MTGTLIHHREFATAEVEHKDHRVIDRHPLTMELTDYEGRERGVFYALQRKTIFYYLNPLVVIFSAETSNVY